MVRKRVLLDSNVWRYIIDADALPALLNAARRSRHVVVISPAVLYEAARTNNVVVRTKLLSAMTSPLWKRMMPEAFSEAEEIRSEVHRVRPEWINLQPDLAWFNRIRYDWMRSKGGNWDRIRTQPQTLELLDDGVTDISRTHAYQRRKETMAWAPTWRTLPLAKVTGQPVEPVKGWNGSPVEAWRFAALNAFSHSLRPATDILMSTGSEAI